MCNRVEVLQWLNEYFDNTANFNRDEINVVTDFSLLWNLFESELSDRGVDSNRLSIIASTINRKSNMLQQQNFYEPIFNYFKARYVQKDNTTNQLFERLRFRHNDNQRLVRNVLTGLEQSSEKIIEAILIIIYRLRNNLFHGEKELHNIHTQYTNFHSANWFLTTILNINKRILE